MGFLKMYFIFCQRHRLAMKAVRLGAADSGVM